MEDDRKICMMKIRVIYALRQIIPGWCTKAKGVAWTFRTYGREEKVLPKTYEVSENFALLGYYAASSGEFLTDVSGQHIGPIFRDKESKKQLPLLAT
jgi:hypothetical protein